MTPTTIYRIWQAEAMRWHHSIIPALRNSRDGIQSHQWRVAMLGLGLFGDHFSRQDLITALTHDIGESWTGDVSYEAKRLYPVIRDAHNCAETDTALRLGFPFGENAKVKLCDGIDCLLWAAREGVDMTAKEWAAHIHDVLRLADALNRRDDVADILSEGGAM